MDIRDVRLVSPEAIEIKLEDIESDSESLPEQIRESTIKYKEFNVKTTTGPKELDSETNYISVNAEETPNKRNNDEFTYVYNIDEPVELLNFNETNSKGDVKCVGRDEPNKLKNVLQEVVNHKQILITTGIPMKIQKLGSDKQIRENGIVDLTGVESVMPKNNVIQKTGNGEQIRKNGVLKPVGKVTGQVINRDLQNGQAVNTDPDKYRTDKIIYDEEIVLTIKGHKCAYCSYESTSRQHIKHHIRFNHRDQAIHKKRKQKMLQCPHCPKKTTHLSSHITNWHTKPEDINWYYCGQCDQKTKFKTSLEKHIKSKHMDRSLLEHELKECKECGKKFTDASHLRRHMQVVHYPEKMTLLKCHFCEFTTNRRDHLKIHMCRHVKPDEGFTCAKCGFYGKNYAELTCHQRDKHQERLQCHLCPYRCKNNLRLKLHLIYHQEKKKDEDLIYKCDKCDYKTYRVYNLTIHMLNHKKPDEIVMFECYHCGYKAKRKDNLKKHIFKHGIYKDILKCFICDFKTSSKYEFTKHVDNHSKEQRDEAEWVKFNTKKNIKKNAAKAIKEKRKK